MGAKTTSEPTRCPGYCTGELLFPAYHDIHVLESLAQLPNVVPWPATAYYLFIPMVFKFATLVYWAVKLAVNVHQCLCCRYRNEYQLYVLVLYEWCNAFCLCSSEIKLFTILFKSKASCILSMYSISCQTCLLCFSLTFFQQQKPFIF